MPGGRQKSNFYAVTYGREIGIFTSWTQASESVIGFGKSKYKGFTTYGEAVVAMESAGFKEFTIFEGEKGYSRKDYEANRLRNSINIDEIQIANDVTQKSLAGSYEDIIEGEFMGDNSVLCGSEASILTQCTAPSDKSLITHTVYIDGSCKGNGTDSAKAGIGLFWGDSHAWNCSYTLSADEAHTSNKAELRAAIKALEIAHDNRIERLIIISDSKYVVSGATQWVYQWSKNGWKTSNNEDVKNKEEWLKLKELLDKNNLLVTWKHVPSHKGIAGNEEADKLAVKGATSDCLTSAMNPAAKASNIPANTKIQPQVIIIPRKIDISDDQVQETNQELSQSTPRRKKLQDKTNTPVPGCINGSSKQVNGLTENFKELEPNSVNSKVHTPDSDQIVQVVKNMELVLENVVFEVRQNRQDSINFRKEVTCEMNKLQKKQDTISDSLSCLMALSTDIQKCINQFETINKILFEEKNNRTSSIPPNDFQAGVAGIQKSITSGLEGVRTSIKSVDTSVASLRDVVHKKSEDYSKDMDKLHKCSKQIQESVKEVEKDVRHAKESVADMEKSMTSLIESETFQQPRVFARQKHVENDNASNTKIPVEDPTFIEVEEEDPEITFAKIVSKDSDQSNKEEMSVEKDKSLEREETEEGKTVDTNEPNTQEENSNTENGRLIYRKPKVCLIGDSISGQVNAAYLGKSTNTFIKKLKAPKIKDIGTYTEQVKDASLIIVHSGVNNLREKESTEGIVSSLVEAITTLKEASSSAKIAVSKVAPVGDRQLEIERNLLNAEMEKKITEVLKSSVTFIDHGNLAERGLIIKEYYRQDKLHLSNNGIECFTRNLRDDIHDRIRTEDNTVQKRPSVTSSNTNDNVSSIGRTSRRDNQDSRYEHGTWRHQDERHEQGTWNNTDARYEQSTWKYHGGRHEQGTWKKHTYRHQEGNKQRSQRPYQRRLDNDREQYYYNKDKYRLERDSFDRSYSSDRDESDSFYRSDRRYVYQPVYRRNSFNERFYEHQRSDDIASNRNYRYRSHRYD